MMEEQELSSASQDTGVFTEDTSSSDVSTLSSEKSPSPSPPSYTSPSSYIPSRTSSSRTSPSSSTSPSSYIPSRTSSLQRHLTKGLVYKVAVGAALALCLLLSSASLYTVQLTRRQLAGSRRQVANLARTWASLELSDHTCPVDWDHHSGSCYFFSYSAASWSTARRICQSKHPMADLATPSTRRENDFLRGGGNQSRLPFVWLGAASGEEDGGWRWVDGGDVPQQLQSENWGPDQPDNFGGNQRCIGLNLAIEEAGSGAWDDGSCDSKHQFVCQVRLGQCPVGWMYWSGACWFVSKKAATWQGARSACRARHGAADLMVPSNNLVQEQIQQIKRRWMGSNVTDIGGTGAGSCPTVGRNLHGRKNANTVRGVQSWGSCAAKCANLTTCTAWLWHHEDAGVWKFQCITMDGFLRINNDKNTIMGLRDCQEKGIWKTLAKDKSPPKSSVQVSSQSPELFVIRSLHNDQWTPGYYNADTKTALVPWGGRANTKVDFQLLSFSPGDLGSVAWVDGNLDGSSASIPGEAVPGGVEDDVPIYICRARKENKIVGGKLVPGHGVCHVAYDNEEVGVNKYQILVLKPKIQTGSPNNEGLWVGATDLGKEGEWLWVDGTAVSKDYWATETNEPNNANGNEHCAEAAMTKLNDVPCDRKYLYICTLQPGVDCVGQDDSYLYSYRGTVNTTASGRSCQRWTSQLPHSHDRTPLTYPKAGLGNHSFCRNPDHREKGPWCYTTDPDVRTESCVIPKCQDPSLEDRLSAIEDTLGHQVGQGARVVQILKDKVLETDSQLKDVESGVRTNARDIKDMQPNVKNSKNTVKYNSDRLSALTKNITKIVDKQNNSAKKITDLRKRVNNTVDKIDDLKTKLDTGGDALQKVNDKVAASNMKMDEVEGDVALNKGNVLKFETKFNKTLKKIDDVQEKVSKNQEKIKNILNNKGKNRK